MKKLLTSPNAQTVLLLIISVTQTVVLIFCSWIPAGIIVLKQVIDILSILEIRFAYNLAYFVNRRHSIWRRKDTSASFDEPSDIAVGITKAGGYLLLFCMQIFMFI